MRKARKVVVRARPENVQDAISELIRKNDVVDITRTTYTVSAETPDRKYIFSSGGFSRKGFTVAASCKRDALQVYTEAGNGAGFWNGIPSATPAAVRYYNIPERPLPPDAVCVDIRAAYPTTLCNLGIIAEPTYRALMGLPKPARLKATGMLGTTRYKECIRDGKIILRTRETEKTAGAFFATCQHVGNVMHELSEECGEDFFLFWVDGMFVRKGRESLAKDFLQSCGYEVSVEPVGNIRRSPSGRYLFYRKEGRSSYLCVPRRLEIDTTEIVTELQNAKHDYYTN